MFLISRPSPRQVERFLEESRGRGLSYDDVSIATESGRNAIRGFTIDETIATVGHGPDDFAAAAAALAAWRHFELGWVRIAPAGAPIAPGTVVAVVIRHLGFWSLNGCRVVKVVSDHGGTRRNGFVYGTLTNHAEQGQELFEVSLRESGDVVYRILAASRPRAWLARVGYPIVRALQSRFRRDSVDAMRRAVVRERA